MAIKSLSIRIDSEMLNKLHYIADYEGRSANSQILILIRDCIEKYEKEHEKICDRAKALYLAEPNRFNVSQQRFRVYLNSSVLIKTRLLITSGIIPDIAAYMINAA